METIGAMQLYAIVIVVVLFPAKLPALQERLARATLTVPDYPNLIHNRLETAMAMI